MELSQNEVDLWERIRGQAVEAGAPRAVCSTLTPFPFWVVIASIVIFIPLALVVAFFVKRQAIVVQGDDVVIYVVGFWTSRVQGEPRRLGLREMPIRREGSKLLIGEESFHLQPGWSGPAARIVELAAS